MRPNISVIYSLIRTVSIHASVKDATFQILFSTAKVSFNPRICKRCDAFHLATEIQKQGFNPRICKRCDEEINTYDLSPSVSIHASVKDATIQLCKVRFGTPVSIHASVKDATELFYQSSKSSVVSIHASVKDATFVSFLLCKLTLFQSTHL